MRPLLLPLVLLCVVASPALAQHHAHATPPPSAAGQAIDRLPWATDMALREGMSRIGRSVAALRHYEHGHIGPAEAATLATGIEQEIHMLVANCKLEPAADAALHGIVGQLLLATAALKSDPADPRAIVSMRVALRAYALDFDDPEFSAGFQAD